MAHLQYMKSVGIRFCGRMLFIYLNVDKSVEFFGLLDLVGRSGVAMEQLDDPSRRKQNRGCYVKIAGDPYQEEQTWFIPLSALKIAE